MSTDMHIAPTAPAPYLEIADDNCPVETSLCELLTSGHRFDTILDTVSDYLNSYGRHTVRQDTDEFGKPITVHEIATGGWSGVEEVVSALGYTMGWRLSWNSSHTGGLHILHVTDVAAACTINLSTWECEQLFDEPGTTDHATTEHPMDGVDVAQLTVSLKAMRGQLNGAASGLDEIRRAMQARDEERDMLVATLAAVSELCESEQFATAGEAQAAIASRIHEGLYANLGG